MGRGLVEGLGLGQGRRVPPVQRVQAAADEPLLEIARVIGPGAAEDEQFHLVGGVADVLQRLQAAGGLGERVVAEADGPLYPRLVGQVGFGGAGDGRAVEALPPAGVRWGEDGDGGDAGDGAGRFTAEGLGQARVKGHLSRGAETAVGAQESVAGVEAAARPGVAAQDGLYPLRRQAIGARGQDAEDFRQNRRVRFRRRHSGRQRWLVSFINVSR